MSHSAHSGPQLQDVMNDYVSMYGISLLTSTSTPTSERTQQLWCQRLYDKYIQDSPHKIKQGQYAALVYPDEKVHLFDTYELALRGTRALARNRGLLITEHRMDNFREIAYMTIETGCSSKIPRVRAQIVDPNKEDVTPLNVELIMDIGATVCILPQSLCTQLQLKSVGLPIEIQTSGATKLLEIVDVEISLDGLPYRAPKVGYILGSESGLLGQTFLNLCQHTWTGLQKVTFKFLDQDLDFKSPNLSQSKELSTLDRSSISCRTASELQSEPVVPKGALPKIPSKAMKVVASTSNESLRGKNNASSNRTKQLPSMRSMPLDLNAASVFMKPRKASEAKP